MPGLIVFKRRWSIGSDDLVVPASFLAGLHLIWLIVLSVCMDVLQFSTKDVCSRSLHTNLLGYIVILSLSIMLEILIAWVSMRGSILETEPRKSMPYLLYARLAILLAELAWIVYGSVWLGQNYEQCPDTLTKEASVESPLAMKVLLGIVICNWIIMACVIIAIFCVFDTSGAKYVKFSRYQASLQQGRTWRRRRNIIAYRQRWVRRLRFCCCCVDSSGGEQKNSSFAEIAELFADFFGELDVVPSDVIASLVLLRKHQKLRMAATVSKGTDGIYQFLSGVPVYPNTRFLRLKAESVLADYKKTAHFFLYASAAYGWPFFVYENIVSGCCKLMPYFRCSGCCRSNESSVLEDNCCLCNYAALRRRTKCAKQDLIYVTYHNAISEPTFFVALDHKYKKIVISVRGTLSFHDVITDLSADTEQLPVDPPRDDWFAHKGMIHSALYIRDKLQENSLIQQAQKQNPEKGTSQYGLVIVGHSLGAGTAAILAMLMQKDYPSLHCYAYSPPGGLMSKSAMEESKRCITTVILGKDIISRLGLSQLESLRADLINVIKRSNKHSKWRIISSGMFGCCGGSIDSHLAEVGEELIKSKGKVLSLHDSVNLSESPRLYPPGRIIHIVRNHPKKQGGRCSSSEPVYQAIWADNEDFNEILVSPRMLTDHMPECVSSALEKVLINVGPTKPTRKLSESERRALLTDAESPNTTLERPSRLYLESSFSNHSTGTAEVQPASNRSSLSWEYTSPLEAAASPGNNLEKEPLVKKENSIEPKNKTYPFKSSQWESSAPDESSAPLATPESLSETSSIDSTTSGSKKYFSGYLKLSEGVDKMAPIEASPSHRKSSGVSADTGDAPCPNTVEDDSFSSLMKWAQAPLAQSTPYRNTITTEAQVENDAEPLTLTSEPLPIGEGDEAGETKAKENEETVLNDSGATFDLDEKSRKMYDKLKRSESQESYKLTYEDELSSSCGAKINQVTTSDYEPQSPMFSTQQQYDPIQGHYSNGGRGYPHGSYQPVVHSESDTHLACSAVPCLDRCKETPALPELEDDTAVFHNHGSPVLGENQPLRSRHFSSPATTRLADDINSKSEEDEPNTPETNSPNSSTKFYIAEPKENIVS